MIRILAQIHSTFHETKTKLGLVYDEQKHTPSAATPFHGHSCVLISQKENARVVDNFRVTGFFVQRSTFMIAVAWQRLKFTFQGCNLMCPIYWNINEFVLVKHGNFLHIFRHVNQFRSEDTETRKTIPTYCFKPEIFLKLFNKKPHKNWNLIFNWNSVSHLICSITAPVALMLHSNQQALFSSN